LHSFEDAIYDLAELPTTEFRRLPASLYIVRQDLVVLADQLGPQAARQPS
jgi:hypothetical protein